MGLRNSSVLCLALFLAFSSSIQGLDITKTLSNYPQFAKFSKYLTETKLADQINSQKAVTILALDDAALSSLSGKPADAIKAVLGSHVVLEFYDEQKLSRAQGSHTRLSTIGGPGIFVGLINEGEIAFSSADNQNSYDSKLVQTVTKEAGTFSLLQVSAPIVVPGAADAAPSKPASPSPPTPSSSPSPPTPSSSPSPPTPSSTPPPPPRTLSSSSPSPSSSSPKPSSPVSSPSTPPTAAAAAVAPVAAANATAVADSTPAPSSSSASRAVVGLVGGAVMAMASLFFSL